MICPRVMMSTKTTDKTIAQVQGLITLAVDPAVGEIEARTAALTACKVIHSNKLTICVSTQEHERLIEDSYADGFRDGDVAARKACPPPSRSGPRLTLAPTPHSSSRSSPPSPSASSPSSASTRKGETRTEVRAMSHGACPHCGSQWTTGERIAWSAALGSTCFDCRDTDVAYP